MRDKQQQIQFQNALIPSNETIYFHIQFGNQMKTNHSMVIIEYNYGDQLLEYRLYSLYLNCIILITLVNKI